MSGAQGCYINPPPATLRYTNCTSNSIGAHGVVCEVECADGYDTPVDLVAGNCATGDYSKPNGTCSKWQWQWMLCTLCVLTHQGQEIAHTLLETILCALSLSPVFLFDLIFLDDAIAFLGVGAGGQQEFHEGNVMIEIRILTQWSPRNSWTSSGCHEHPSLQACNLSCVITWVQACS